MAAAPTSAIGTTKASATAAKTAATTKAKQAADDAKKEWDANKDDPDIQTRINKLTAWEKALKIREKTEGTVAVQVDLNLVAEWKTKLVIMKRISDQYGITLQQSAGVKAINAAYSNVPKAVRDQLKPKDWTLEELEDVEAALKNYQELLGPKRAARGLGAQPVTAFSRLKQGIDVNAPTGKLDTSTIGETFTQNGSANISMFDVSAKDFAANKSKPTKDELRKGFRGTIIHELSHGLVEEALSKLPGGDKIIKIFIDEINFWESRYVSPYWKDAGYDQPGFDYRKTVRAAKKAKVEIPITEYGMKNANEDLAETLMFYFEDSGKLQSKCPKRLAFVQNHVKPLLDPPKSKK